MTFHEVVTILLEGFLTDKIKYKYIYISILFVFSV